MAAPKQTTLVDPVDDELQHRVKICLRAKHLELGRLLVLAKGGTVRLSGLVSSFHVRQLALSATSRMPGVHHIVDDIDVFVSSHEAQKRVPR